MIYEVKIDITFRNVVSIYPHVPINSHFTLIIIYEVGENSVVVF